MNEFAEYKFKARGYFYTRVDLFFLGMHKLRVLFYYHCGVGIERCSMKPKRGRGDKKSCYTSIVRFFTMLSSILTLIFRFKERYSDQVLIVLHYRLNWYLPNSEPLKYLIASDYYAI